MLRIHLKICKQFVLVVTFQNFFYFHFQMSKQAVLTIANRDLFSLNLRYLSQSVPFCKWFHF